MKNNLFNIRPKTKGATATIKGSTTPADVNSMNTMAEGLYTETSIIENYHKSGIKAIAFNEGTVLSTKGVPMPGGRVHRGNIKSDSRKYDSKGNPWTTGCLTFGYGANTFETAKAFAENFTENTNVYLKRY